MSCTIYQNVLLTKCTVNLHRAVIGNYRVQCENTMNLHDPALQGVGVR